MREQYYFHWKRNPSCGFHLGYEHIKESLKDVLKFWLDNRVDGFYFGKVEYLSIDPDTHQTRKDLRKVSLKGPFIKLLRLEKSMTKIIFFRMIVIHPVPICVILTKEELQCYDNNPSWKRFSFMLLILFGWICTITVTMTIVMLATSPKCLLKSSLEHMQNSIANTNSISNATSSIVPWWLHTVRHQIWTKSFYDSDNDGIGDVNGITQRVKKFASMGFQSIWPVPLLRSSTGNGYDVINFNEIDPQVGTMADVEKLIAETHKHYMKFVMDIPLTVVSIEHDWFIRSALKYPEYIDYFIWRDNPQTIPQHWEELDSTRREFFFHWKNKPKYAILNWASEHVRERMKDVVKFWLEKGVDGFYFGKIEYLSINQDNDQTDWDTVNDYLDEITNFTRSVVDREVLLCTRFDDIIEIPRYVGINASLVDIASACGAECIYDKLKEVGDFHINNESFSMWEIGNPRVSRVITRMGSREGGELVNMLLLVLPGELNTYYGDEIGMEGYSENQRSAMQWNGENNGSFSVLKNTISVNADFKEINLNPPKIFMTLDGLRHTEEALLYGPMVLGPKNDSLVTIIRNSVTGTVSILCVLNFGYTAAKFDLTNHFVGINVTLADKDISTMITTTNLRNIYQEGSLVDISQLYLMPNEGIVLKLNPKK